MVSRQLTLRSALTGMAFVLTLAPFAGQRAWGENVPSVPQARSLSSSDRSLGRYVVSQLDRLTRSNWARVAGRDAKLPPRSNGHDEFASAWTREIMKNLHGLHAGVFKQPFPTPGFRTLPANLPGVNIVVAVPGSRHPEKAIIIGAHHDGEPFSKGSAYDDASGCAITLGLARYLGELWRSKGRPSLTVEFALFDAEEQGLVGSSNFAFAYRHGALMPKPVLMIDEEQNGVGYPARPFGLASEQPMPAFAISQARIPAFTSRTLAPVMPPSSDQSDQLRTHMGDAATTVFQRLAAAYPSIPYRGGTLPAFRPEDRGSLVIGPSSECCSDDAPFSAVGVPTATLSGDASYYSRNAPPWAFPFDQPQDTLTALACDTEGMPKPGTAFEAALNLPLQMSRELVRMYSPPARGTGFTLFSTAASRGRAARLRAIGGTRVTWLFGDGTHARGASVEHTYRKAGTYSVTVTTGGKHRSFWMKVQAKATRMPIVPPLPVNPPPIKPWHPDQLQNIPGCSGL